MNAWEPLYRKYNIIHRGQIQHNMIYLILNIVTLNCRLLEIVCTYIERRGGPLLYLCGDPTSTRCCNVCTPSLSKVFSCFYNLIVQRVVMFCTYMFLSSNPFVMNLFFMFERIKEFPQRAFFKLLIIYHAYCFHVKRF